MSARPVKTLTEFPLVIGEVLRRNAQREARRRRPFWQRFRIPLFRIRK